MTDKELRNKLLQYGNVHPDDRPKPTPPKSKRRAERNQPSMDIRPANFNWNEYIVACVYCKSRANLCLIGQRCKEELLVGWVFCCKSCFDVVNDKEISIEFLKLGHSKEEHD